MHAVVWRALRKQVARWSRHEADRTPGSTIESGRGRPGDRELLLSVAAQILGNTICALGDAAALPVQSFATRFADDFERHITMGQCPNAGKGGGA